MQKFLLDTSALIDLIRDKEWIIKILEDHINDTFVTSSICEVELLEGGLLSKNPEKERKIIAEVLRRVQEIMPFDSPQAEAASNIRFYLRKKGQKIEDFDTLIAAAAIASGSTLVTRNTKHFSRIPQLQLYSLPE